MPAHNNLFKSIKLILIGCIFISNAWGQSTWKLVKAKDGISIYESGNRNSSFHTVKVECTLEGTYDKLMSILNNVPLHKDWVYNNKTSYILKRLNPNELYYYAEYLLPWPMANRDAILHMKMTKDSLNRFLKISVAGIPNYLPEKTGIVRVPKSVISWYVTMPTANTIHIIYQFEANPGGSLPAWLVNSFADKGPFESFKKLAVLLKKQS
jgi:hypothetical protein